MRRWYNLFYATITGELGAKKMRVGILDDHAGICEMLSIALKMEGHTIYACQDSAEFLARVIGEQTPPSSGGYDLMIVDYHLAGELSGVDVIRQVREFYPDLPALLISAEHLKTLEAAKEGLSGVRLLLKPIRLSTLLATIKEMRSESLI